MVSQKYLLQTISTDFTRWKLKKLTRSLSYYNSLFSLMSQHQFFRLLKERSTFRNTILSGRYQRHRCRFKETYSNQLTPAEKDKFKKVIKAIEVHLHAFDKSTSIFLISRVTVWLSEMKIFGVSQPLWRLVRDVWKWMERRKQSVNNIKDKHIISINYNQVENVCTVWN